MYTERVARGGKGSPSVFADVESQMSESNSVVDDFFIAQRVDQISKRIFSRRWAMCRAVLDQVC